MEDIKEVARKAALTLDPRQYRDHDFAADVAALVVAELQKDATAVAWACEFYVSPGYEHQDGFWMENVFLVSKSNIDACKNDRSYRNWTPLFTRPQPKAATVPEGWKLVPKKATREMVEAAMQVHEPLDGDENDFIAEFRRTYRAMLSAAPSLPAVGPIMPEQASEAMLRPFYECPPEELQLAYQAMRKIAEVEQRRSTSLPAQSEGEQK